jgi:hypothetical protein
MIKTIIFLIFFIFLSFSASAGPAPWYEWKQLSTGEIVCSQTVPGKGWVRYTGPYTDMKCSIRGDTFK